MKHFCNLADLPTTPASPMKTFTVIMPLALLALSTVNGAEDNPADAPTVSYPELPGLVVLLAVQAADDAAFPNVKDPGDPSQIAKSAPQVIVADLAVAGDPLALARTASPPDVVGVKETGDPTALAASVKPLSLTSVKETGNPVDLAETVKPPTLAAVKETSDPIALADTIKPPPISALAEPTVPDLFTISQFNWNRPHGQWMNQMLKDIAAAKAAGDIETYNTLTARYAAWAEKYLRHDDPPDLDGKPGR